MSEISLKEFMTRDGMTQAKAAALLGITQGGVAWMLRDIEMGKRDVCLVFDDQDQLIDCYSKRKIPLPAPQEAA
jgi:predicted transcriptional regulator